MGQLHLRLRVQPEIKSRGFLKGINFFSFAGYAMVISYFPLYFKEIGLSVKEIALVLAIGPLVSAFSQPFWGFMADKSGSARRTILIVVSLTALSCWGVFFKESFYWVFVFMTFFMFFSSPIGPLTELLNLDVSVKHGVPYGTIRAWAPLGFSVSSIASGTVLSWIGLSGMVYLYSTCMMLLIFCALNSEDRPASANKMEAKDMLWLLRHRPFLKFLLFVMMIAVPHKMNDSWLAIFLDSMGTSKQMIGVAFMLAAVSETIVFLFFSAYIERFEPKKLLYLSAFGYSLRWVLYGFIASPIAILVLQLFHALTFAVFFAASIRYIAMIVPDSFRGSGQGLFSAFFVGIAGMIGSLSGGWVMSVFDGEMMYLLGSLLSLVGGIYMMTKLKGESQHDQVHYL